jgi:hypothetical protein
MSAKKFLRLVSGRIQEIAGVTSSAGAGNDGDIPALDSTGRLDVTMMPVGVAPDVKIIAATEDLSAGDFVNIYNSTGLKCRKADATAAGKEANGFVLAAVTSGQNATVYFDSINTQVSGFTVGAVVYLSTTPGQATETVPSGSGNVVQELGQALTATEIEVDLQGRGVILA